MIFTFQFGDQSYDYDDDTMGLGEARFVKAETGLYGSAFFEAVKTMDPDAIACLVVLAMRRAGKTDATMESVGEEVDGYFQFIRTVNETSSPANRAERRARRAVTSPN